MRTSYQLAHSQCGLGVDFVFILKFIARLQAVSRKNQSYLYLYILIAAVLIVVDCFPCPIPTTTTSPISHYSGTWQSL